MHTRVPGGQPHACEFDLVSSATRPNLRLLCEAVSIDRGRGREGKDAEYRIEREPRRERERELSLDSRIIEEIRAIGDVAPEEDER